MLTLVGGSALAVRLGAEHRRLNFVELQVSGEDGLLQVPPTLQEVATESYSSIDGLRFRGETTASRPIDLGQAAARQFVMLVTLDTAETAVRLNVEEGGTEPEAERMEVTAPFDLGEPATMAVATPAAIFSDAVERIVRRDALRVPMRSLLDAWLCTQIDPLENLAVAIAETFGRRGTPVPREEQYTLSEEFVARDHVQRQWSLFIEREAPAAQVDVEDAMAAVCEVAMAAFKALR
jgi:Nucleotidyl transferase AbiEii toxin, Type IV TA system